MSLTAHFSLPIFSLFTEGTSGSYGFLYLHKIQVRGFFCVDGSVVEDLGSPLPEETGFQMNQNVTYDDIHGLAKKLGLDWDGAQNLSSFIVKHLEYNEDLRLELE